MTRYYNDIPQTNQRILLDFSPWFLARILAALVSSALSYLVDHLTFEVGLLRSFLGKDTREDGGEHAWDKAVVICVDIVFILFLYIYIYLCVCFKT